MAVIYVKEQGAFIQKSREKIIISKKGEQLAEFPLIQIENIAIIGNVQVSTQALHTFMERGIDVSYFNYNGKYLGNTAAEASKNIFLRFEQYRFYMDEERRLKMAKSIVQNKIENQLAVIREYRRKDVEYEWDRDLAEMSRLQNSLWKAGTANEILGIEGMCSNIYFSAFAHMLQCDFEFHGRNRRPPKDPVNIILSLAYTFLTKEVAGDLDGESFEPYLGFLHGIRYGRKSLALDIVEEFRQPVVDRLVLLLFNKRMLGQFDFEYVEDGHVSLAEDGFKKFCHEYERWINGRNSLAGEKSFRTVIRGQISMLKKAIRENGTYKPYSWKEHAVCDQL